VQDHLQSMLKQSLATLEKDEEDENDPSAELEIEPHITAAIAKPAAETIAEQLTQYVDCEMQTSVVETHDQQVAT